MNSSKLFFALASVGCCLGFAGETSMSFTGKVSKNMDYVVVGVTVTSGCQPSGRDAVSAVDVMTKDIHDLFEGYVTPKAKEICKEPLKIVGGGYQKDSSTMQTPKGDTWVPRCKDGYTSSKRITLETTDFTKVGEIQEKASVITAKHQKNDAGSGPTLSAVFSSPRAEWTDKTKEELSLLSLRDALRQAKMHMAVLAKDCNMGTVDLKSVSGAGAGYRNKSYGEESMARSAFRSTDGGVGGSPSVSSLFSFGAEDYTQAWTFVFSNAGGSIDLSSCKVPN